MFPDIVISGMTGISIIRRSLCYRDAPSSLLRTVIADCRAASVPAGMSARGETRERSGGSQGLLPGLARSRVVTRIARIVSVQCA